MSQPDNKLGRDLYEFSRFRLDAAERLLLHDGDTVHLTPKVFDLLVALVENSGRLLEKEELMERVWPDSYVEEGNINRNISTLRRALSGSGGSEEFIETVPKRGYRFIAPVRRVPRKVESGRLRLIETRASHSGETIQPAIVKFPHPDTHDAQTSTLKGLYLRRVILPVGLLLLIVIGGLWYLSRRSEKGNVGQVRRIAVLPFKFAGASKDEEYLGLGLTDALITRLGNLRGISVRPTSLVGRYQQEGQDIIAAGRALKVDAVLDGRVRKFGENFQVTMQLVSVDDQSTIWTGEAVGRFADIQTLQDSISSQVVRGLSLKLTADEENRLTRRYTRNAEANNAYLKGRYFWHRRGPDWTRKALETFERAISLDPNYALAYAGLADTYIIIGDHGRTPPAESFPQARDAAIRALEIDEKLAEAHTALALIRFRYDWDAEAAEREHKRALELNPNYPLGYGWYSLYLISVRRFDEARNVIRQGLAIDPLLPSLYVYSAFIELDSGALDQAIAEARKALELDPDFLTANYVLGLALEQKGAYAEALPALTRALRLSPSYKADLAHLYAVSGNTREAVRILDELKAEAARTYIKDYNFAKIYAGLGRRREAIASLSRAVDDHDPFVINLAVEPRFEPLRTDPEYRELMRRVGLWK